MSIKDVNLINNKILQKCLMTFNETTRECSYTITQQNLQKIVETTYEYGYEDGFDNGYDSCKDDDGYNDN